MNRKIEKTVVILCFALFLPAFVYSQSEFETAHALLEKLANDRGSIRATSDRARVEQETKTVPVEVEHLINEGISNLLNRDAAVSQQNLQQTLRAALQIGSVQPETGQNAFVFASAAKDPSYLIIYNVTYCAACSLSWIGTFVSDAGHYKQEASLQDPIPNQSLSAAPLWISDDVIRVIVYGTTWGDAHSRLNVLAYSFDGRQLEKLWERTGLPQGTVQIRPGAMVVSFLTALRPPWKERSETYAITAKGIQLQAVSERPQ